LYMALHKDLDLPSPST